MFLTRRLVQGCAWTQNARAVCTSLEAIQTTKAPGKPERCVLSPHETVVVTSKTGKHKKKIRANLEIICSVYFPTESSLCKM